MRTVFGKGNRDGKSSCLFSRQTEGPIFGPRAKAGCSVRYIQVLYSRHDGVGALTTTYVR